MNKKVVLIAGANGSGKTTFAKKFISEFPYYFLNADEIAKKLAPDNVDSVQLSAGKKYFKKLDNLLKGEEPFIIESTLSGKGMKRILADLKNNNFDIQIIYLFLENTLVCKARVEERVKKGGHYIPPLDIERRYWRSKANFWNTYKNMVNEWSIYYNSNNIFEEVAFGVANEFEIVNNDLMNTFMMGIES